MNELITLEINSKNKQKLIDLLNENNLVVEYLNITETYSVVRPDEITGGVITHPEDERVDPQPKVLEPFNWNLSEST